MQRRPPRYTRTDTLFPDTTRLRSEQPGAFGPRCPEEFVSLAWTIREVVKASILALSEINGVPGESRSVELGRLAQQLGSRWAYRIARSGGKQRVADRKSKRLNSSH